jgi:hypothetical protein
MPEKQFQVNKYIRMALSFLVGVLGVNRLDQAWP